MNYDSISSRNDFFELLGLPKKNITFLLYKKKIMNCYSSFEIKKKSGGIRTINAPNTDLMIIQKRIAKVLLDRQNEVWESTHFSNTISHAFEKKKNIISNAFVHRNKRFVLNLDLEHFFDSFHFGRVRGFFEKNKDFKVPQEVATIIAQLTCYNGSLPQGAPSSPIITNLICRILDMRILKLSKKFKLDYTRYADDLTFSTNDRKFLSCYDEFVGSLTNEIIRAGFVVNEKKTRLQFKQSRQEVTGLIVNKKINVKKEYFKKTRAMAHSQYTREYFLIDSEVGSIKQLEGRFAFINQLDRYNNKIERLKNEKSKTDRKTAIDLLAREREYQKFLFYKYFYHNEKPLIVTEGKTDVKYLKAALKNLYSEFPKLIEKTENGFRYKVSFLNRSYRLQYFFQFTIHGADAIKNLYEYFIENERSNHHYPNYLNYFKRIKAPNSPNPIFFIFDNETKKDKKPLKKFIEYAKEFNKQKTDYFSELEKNLNVNLVDDLYLVTIPLIEEKETEMEDLFDSEVLNHKINGKKFSKKGDSTNCYGKEVLATYIFSNYENINFEKFKPVLRILSDAIPDVENS